MRRLGRPARARVIRWACEELEAYFARVRCASSTCRVLPTGHCSSDRRGMRSATLHSVARSHAVASPRAGNPGSVRAVGTANSTNPIPILVPCHGVFGSGGSVQLPFATHSLRTASSPSKSWSARLCQCRARRWHSDVPRGRPQVRLAASMPSALDVASSHPSAR